MKMMFCLQQTIFQTLSGKLNGPCHDFSICQTLSSKFIRLYNSFPFCETLSHKLKGPQVKEVVEL